MELQVQDLISSIKKEGVDAANAQAEEILAQAREQAAKIIADAKQEAQKCRDEAEAQNATLRENTRVNAQQARRDAVLAFKADIQAQFEKLLAADVKNTVQGDTLAGLIRAALAEEDPAGYAAEVAQVSDGLKGELAAEIQKGLEIRVSKNVKAGFRLAAKDGSGYFDCTDDEITQMLMPFFSELSI